MSLLFNRANKKQEIFLDNWKPILTQAMTSSPQKVPRLTRPDAKFFIDEWNRLYETANKENKTALAVFAYRLEIHRYAAGMLIDHRLNVRLSGIKILGNMGDESAWTLLSALIKHSQSDISFAAFKALTKINSRRWLDEFLELMLTRYDWPIERLVETLSEIPDADLYTIVKSYTIKHQHIQCNRIRTILESLKKNTPKIEIPA